MVLQTPSPLPRLRKDEAGQYKRLKKWFFLFLPPLSYGKMVEKIEVMQS